MKRYLDDFVLNDLATKAVVLTGPRQVGKTTLSRQLMQSFPSAQYLNWDVLADRVVLQRQSWNPRAKLLVMDEIHKMPNWKAWLKGVIDGRLAGQSLLVTGSARMETFRQAGDSLAGRYFSFKLHPISVLEWCVQQGVDPAVALDHLLERGGFPEPCLAADAIQAERWRAQYFTDLIREDVLEFSRLHEITTMRLFVELLRERVGSPLSLASIARDLAVAPATLKRYLDILQALFIVFTVHPWHRNVARAILQAPKVYFFDTGLVRGDQGIRLENAVAGMLLKQADFLRDSAGREVSLHYIRTKDDAEVDFAFSEAGELTQLIECKLSDNKPHRALARFAAQFPDAQAVQLVYNLRQEEFRNGIMITNAANWLSQLSA
ncbi:ATP-binding protein [Methylotenera sp.]|uniref:ATP-binding protein n=1 Tax=Methylotenera sp. TaxID=2051956 RepID=UPI0027303D6F|nr:ATP-binding protein [Methylotenera sp.]MDP2071930.1 ATP-binding protein [Methylotenera sp.]MDP3005555.1 ATP-binding protein [Methylotenera sp.]